MERKDSSHFESLCHCDPSNQVSAHSDSGLCHCDPSHQVSAHSDLGFGMRCRLKNFKMAAAMAAILDIRMEQF